MSETIRLALSGSGASGCWREKASRRWVSAAARCAPSIAPSTKRSTSVSPFASLRCREIQAADDDRQHVVEIVRDAAGQLADSLHLLHLAQLLLGLGALLDLLDDALLQRGVQRLKRRLRPAPLGELSLDRLEQPRIVDRRRGLAGDAAQNLLMLGLNFPGSAWPKKSPPITSPEREITGTAR